MSRSKQRISFSVEKEREMLGDTSVMMNQPATAPKINDSVASIVATGPLISNDASPPFVTIWCQ